MGRDRQEEKGEWIPVGDGVELYAEVRGAGPDTVVVPLAVWLAPVLEPLGEGRTLILYDMRGRGRSTPVEDPALLGLARDLEDLDAVRGHYGVSRTALIGFSYLGAMTALYAAEHPERVTRLVQVGPMPPRSDAPYLRQRDLGELLGRDAVARLESLRSDGVPERDPLAYCRAFWEVYAPLYVGSQASVAEAIRQAEATCAHPNERPPAFLRTLGHVVGHLGPYDWRSSAAAIRSPTLVIHGTADRAAPVEGGREWADANPRARFLPIEGAGHFVWIDRAPALLSAVDRFLDEP